METPNDNWHEVSNPETIITLTDGKDKVTVKEFRKDDEIPMPIISFDNFEEIYQTYYTTADTVYMITGFAQTRTDIDEVRSVVESIQLADHQKQEEKKEQKQEPQKPLQPEQIVRTGNNLQLFYINSNSVTVYEYTDGSWMDDQGILYWTTVEHEWANSE